MGDIASHSCKDLIWTSIKDVCNKIFVYNVISRNALPKHKHLANSGRVQHRPKGLSDDQHKPKCQETTVWISGKLIYKVSKGKTLAYNWSCIYYSGEYFGLYWLHQEHPEVMGGINLWLLSHKCTSKLKNMVHIRQNIIVKGCYCHMLTNYFK